MICYELAHSATKGHLLQVCKKNELMHFDRSGWYSDDAKISENGLRMG